MSDTEEAVVPDADTNQGVIEAAEGEGEDAGPVVLQPRVVQYCGRCGLPLEYCEFGPTPEECARGESGEALEDAAVVEAEDESAAGERATKKKSKKGAQAESVVTITRLQRNKRKFVTMVSGLGTFGIKPKDATKALASKFSCGVAGRGKADEIDIQGDFKKDLPSFLQEKWNIPEDSIVVVEEDQKMGKRRR